MTLPLLNLAETPDTGAREKAGRLHDVAKALQSRLAAPHTVTRSLLKRLMSEAFGGSDAEGHWSMRDAYDALEAAQASDMLSPGDDAKRDTAPKDDFAGILAFEKTLPTQTYRSEHQVEMQQFSTPAALGWLAARAAAITAEDHVLEPSAGTGMLAARAIAAGAAVTLNERDPCRAALLALVTNGDVTTHDAEFINDRLPPDVQPTVVLINPPSAAARAGARIGTPAPVIFARRCSASPTAAAASRSCRRHSRMTAAAPAAMYPSPRSRVRALRSRSSVAPTPSMALASRSG
jgi:Dimethyladenosine transferase (rRNA methylation)